MQLATFSKANLPAVTSLSASLRAIQPAGGVGGGAAIIKMDKGGHWVFGADQTEVESDSKWAVNPFSFVHGFIAWGDGEVLGEKMTSVANPLPDLDEAPSGAKKGWEQQVGMSLQCVSGDDKGTECRYTVTSVGGKRAVQTLAVALADQVDKDQTKPVAIVRLKKDSYAHKSYGRIYTPVFEIIDWVSMDGEADEVAEPAEEAPAGRRRRAA
jgi:hypothetical protein